MPQISTELIEALRGVTGFDEVPFINTHLSGEKVTSIRLNPAKPLIFTAIESSADNNISSQPSQNINHSSNNPQPPTSNFQLPTSNPQPPTSNPQPPTSNPQPPTSTPQPPTESIPWCETGRYLSERPSFTLDPTFHAGAYYVQEASSMFLHHIVKHIYKEENAPKRMLDLCAAPGGKSTLLAASFPNSFLVSNEVIKSRVTILAENISKWGSSDVVVTHNEPRDFNRLPGFFDLMVVDAPCSGSGLFRKDPMAINEWSEGNVDMCSVRQQRILTDAIPALKQNGYLVYSTCSYSKQENEDICDWLIDEFGLKSVQIPLDRSWGITEAFSDKHDVPAYRFYPDKLKGEGFFIASFKQTKQADEDYSYSSSIKGISKAERSIVEPWLDKPAEYEFIKQKETIIAFPKIFQEEIATVQQQLNVRKSGVGVGVIKGSDLIPHHELGLSLIVSPSIPFLELNRDNALLYLKEGI